MEELIKINSQLEAKLEETVAESEEKEKMAKAEQIMQFSTITKEKAAEKNEMSTRFEN